ncbi:Outer membrane porin F precursor [compost metagenome]
MGTLKYTNGDPIEGVAVEIYNAKNEKIRTLYSDKEGKYSVELLPFTDYKLIFKKAGLTEREQTVLPLKPTEKREYSFDFINEMEVIVDNVKVIIKEGDDLTDKLKLNPIYFDYNGFKIRESSKAELDKIVEVMKVRPSISIKINSHTDSRGKDDFNMKLSQNRAKSTMDYIISHGIEKERVSAEGFGETRLINKCSNGVKCSEAEHQENRRSEFIIQLNKN